MFNTVSARQIQREYKKIFQRANKSKDPIIVISNNKPVGAVIGLDQLEKIRLQQVLSDALEEYKAGKTKSISTPEELKADFKEMRKEAGI